MVRRTSTVGALRRPRCSWPSVARRRFSCATARCTAARSWAGLVGSVRSSSASGRAGGRRRGALDGARSSSRRRWRSNRSMPSRSIGGRSPALLRRARARSPNARRIRCTSTPTTPEPSPRRPKAAIASLARSRISPSLPSAIAWRTAWRSASRSISPSSAPSLLADAALERLGLGGAEEEAVEEQSSKTRRSSWDLADRREGLAEVVLAGPRHRLERGERIEHLGGPDRGALVASTSQKETSRGAGPGGGSPSVA